MFARCANFYVKYNKMPFAQHLKITKCKLKWHDSFHYATEPSQMQSIVYIIKKIIIFLQKYLHINKECNIFAPRNKKPVNFTFS